MYMVAGGDASLDRTARLGLNACGRGGTGAAPGDKAAWQDFRARWHAALAKYGRNPADYKTNSHASLYVTDDPERAWAKYRERIFYQRSYTRHSGIQPYSFHFPEGKTGKPEDMRGWEHMFLTPDEAARRIRESWSESGPDEVLLSGGGPDVPFEDSIESLRLFAEKVIPQLGNLVEAK